MICLVDLNGAHSEARDRSLRSSPLVELAEVLSSAPYRQQRHFARTALQALIAEYELAVADAAYDASRSREASRRSRQWRATTEAYLNQLRQLARILEKEPPLSIHVDAQREVHLFVGRDAVTLDSPFLNRSRVLGDRIQKSYCLVERCAATLAASATRRDPLYGVWSFGDDQGAVLSTTVGVQCAFLNVTGKLRKESLCKQVAGELTALAEALLDHRRSGRLIEWDSLAIRETSPVRQERVILNRRRESLALDLAALAQLGSLSDSIRDWLRRRVEGGRPELVLSQADGDLSDLVRD